LDPVSGVRRGLTRSAPFRLLFRRSTLLVGFTVDHQGCGKAGVAGLESPLEEAVKSISSPSFNLP
jgi:hypothetical protein